MKQKDTLFFTFRRSRKARMIRVEIGEGGQVTVVCPWWVSSKEAIAFYDRQRGWVDKHRTPKLQARAIPDKIPRDEFLPLAARAKSLAENRIAHFNQHYGFTYRAITIGNYRSQWGCCRRDGTLCFHYRILYLTSALQDYLVVHELCHLGAFNHSQRFWDLVGETIPQYRAAKKKIMGLHPLRDSG